MINSAESVFTAIKANVQYTNKSVTSLKNYKIIACRKNEKQLWQRLDQYATWMYTQRLSRLAALAVSIKHDRRNGGAQSSSWQLGHDKDKHAAILQKAVRNGITRLKPIRNPKPCWLPYILTRLE